MFCKREKGFTHMTSLSTLDLDLYLTLSLTCTDFDASNVLSQQDKLWNENDLLGIN